MTISASTLKKHLKKALYKDQFRFQRRIDGALKQQTAEKVEHALVKIACDIQSSIDQRENRFINLPKVSYPETLPVSQKKDTILAAIRDNQVSLLLVRQVRVKPPRSPKSV